MPYQETICGDEKREEYRLALDQGSLQNQSTTPRLCGDKSNPLQPQRQVTSRVSVGYEAQPSGNRNKMHAIGLPATTFHSLSLDSRLQDNLSFGNKTMLPMHHMSEIDDSGGVSEHAFFQGNSFNGGGVSASRLFGRGKLPYFHGRVNNHNLFASTQSDGALDSKPNFRQRLGFSLPANFPESCDGNVIDLNDELVQASACVLSPDTKPKRRRLNSDDLVLDQEDAYIGYGADQSPPTPKNEDQINDASPCMGLTPIRFSEMFPLSEREWGEKARVRAGIPLPPFHQSDTRKHNRGHITTFNDVQFDPKPYRKDKLPKTPYSSEPLCLPPKRKNKSASSSKKIIVANSPTKSPISPAHSSSSSVATPSSATIVKLSTTIRNQMHSPFGPVNVSAAEKFATSMEASQYSQQSIHNWDTKFGLRRAHSKTMRESARSRKSVLEFLKGEGYELPQSAEKSTTTRFTSESSTSSKSADEEFNDENLHEYKDVFHETSQKPTDDEPPLNARDSSLISGIGEEHEHDDKSMDLASIGSFSHSNELVQSDEHEGLNFDATEPSPMSGLADDYISAGIDGELEHDDQSSLASVGSFIRTHSNEQDLNKNASSYSSKLLEVDINDEELTNMFRRASLDHMPENFRGHLRSSSLTGPMSEETDIKQSFARGA